MQRKILVAAGAVLQLAGAGLAQAQSADAVMVKLGVNHIGPQVSSGALSAPALPNTRIDVDGATSVILTGTLMLTDHWSVEGFAGLPYKHDVLGAGAIQGVGRIGTVKQVSPTVFLQYRFGQPLARVRPYAGVGLTYAYFYGEEGSGALTAITNPGGPATQMSVDAAWGVSAQLGVALQINKHWFADLAVVKTSLKTTAHLSTGQSIDTRLDPLSVGLSLGYRY